jgi:hypothetical protein
LRFESVGHPAARFAPLELRFDSAEGLPSHAILWLRNGGGKSSMLNLLFALLRPGRREFLGVAEEGKDRRLGDYVLAQDTAHVVAEWGQLGESRPARITGMVLEWQDRARSIDDSRLRRLWYAFVPGDARPPGLLEQPELLRFDTLPFVEDGRRLSLGQFRDRLREAQRADPALELVMPASQSEWHRHLEDIHLDPEAFRYQLQMNREEGGANQLFRRRCRTDAGFVDLLLELAVPAEQPGKVADIYARYADELGRRPQIERQRAFLAGALERLGPLSEASSAHAESVTALDATARDAADLRAALQAAAERDAQESVRQQERAEALEAQAVEEDSRRNRLTSQAAEARRRAAGFRLDEAVAAHEEALRAEVNAEREETAWMLVGSLAARRTTAAELESVIAELERVESEAEPLRRERDTAATALAARLVADEHMLLADAEAAEREADEAVSAAQAAADERLQAVGEAARADAEWAALRDRREGYAQSRRAAEREGLLEPGEEPSAALRDMEDDLVAAETAHAEAEAQLAEATQSWDAAEHRLGGLRERLEQATARALRAGHAVEEMEGAAARLAGVPRLAEVAEISEIVLWDAGETLAAQLDALAVRADQLLVREELEAAEDRHALAALEVDTLLPARRDVEAALAALAEVGIAAAPGWRFIADSVPATGRAAAITARPELADGVVVLDPDRLDAARTALAERGLRPASALAVGPSTLLSPDGDDPRRFVLPAAEALYDRAAGEAERDIRAGRLEGVDARTAALRTARDRDAALTDRLRDLLATYPPDHRARLREEVAAAEAAVQEREAEIVACEAERCELKRRRQDLTARARTLGARIRDLAERAARLRPLLAQAVADAADAAREPELVATIRRLREVEHAAERREHDARQLARRLTETASSRRHGADRCAHRRRDLALPDPGAATAPDDPADVLERRYRVLDERYRQQVTDAVLEERRARAQADLTRLDSDLARAPAEARDRAALLLDAPDGREEAARAVALHAAQAQRRAAIARCGAAESERIQAQRAFEALPAGRELPPDRRPQSAAEADALAEELAEEARLSSGLVTDLRKQSGQAERHAQQARWSNERLVSLVDTLDGALRRVAGVVQVRAPSRAEAFDGDGAAAADPARAAGEALQEAADVQEAARGEVDRRASALQRFVRDRRFDDLEGPLRDRLGTDEPAVLAPRAPAYADDVAVRLAQCDQKLAELDAHRDLLVKEIASTVERALHVLRQAERASVVPDGFGDWSGQRFLHIGFTSPERDEELFARLADMVDAMTAEGLRPEGRVLLQRATHAAVGQRGFRVTILKPTPALRAERVSVTDLATFSGGEQVTAAILLYCTLAVLRARGRGQRSAGGLLVLDNPIGKSSNVTLLELQRRVADGMGVQLLYTTAVDDRDAVGVLPQWIRLRNDRADRRTGAQHVEVDDRDLGAVTAARLWRRPEP